LRSLQSNKKLAAERRRETNFSNQAEKEKWIENYVERETAGARKPVEDAEAVIRQEQENTAIAENTGLTDREPEKRFPEMVVGIGESLSDLTSSDNGEDGEDEDNKETEQGKRSKDDEPSWVIGTISKTVQQHMERFRPKKMKSDKLTQPGWGDATDYFHEGEKLYGTSELRVPAVIKLQMAEKAAVPAPTIFEELMECLDIFRWILQMQQGTSQQGSSQMRLGSRKQQLDTGIPGHTPATEPD